MARSVSRGLHSHQGRLASALHAIQAQEEGPRILAMQSAVGLDAVEDEGNAVL